MRVWRRPARAAMDGGHQVTLLEGADQLFPSLHEALKQATRRICCVTYIFNDDPEALALAQALAEAARRGVAVWVVVDGFGSHDQIPALRAMWAEAGVKLAVFGPMDRWWHWVRPASLWRMHQKICVVDGQWAWVGGINLMADRFDQTHGWSQAPRLDFAVGLQGPVVRTIEATAQAVWHRARWGQDWADQVRHLAISGHPVDTVRRVWRDLRAPRTPLPGPSARVDHALAGFFYRDNFRQRRTIENLYMAALSDAQHTALVVSPYFYPGYRFRSVLKAAAQRGVKVQLLLQGRVDYAVARYAATALYEELLAAGIEIYEYTPAFLHAKVAVIDGRWATVGSSNIDPLSFLLNWEANVVVDDAPFAKALQTRLEAALAVSQRVTPQALPADWRRRWRRRVVDGLARLYIRIAGARGHD